VNQALRAATDEDTRAIVPGGYLVSDKQLLELGDGDIRRGRKRLRLMMIDLREQRKIMGPTAKPDGVRIATPEDEEAVLELLRVDHRENAIRVAPFDDERCLEYIRVGTRRRGGITAVIDGKGGPIACTVLVPVQWAFSKSYYMQEVFNFVHPDHRTSDNADRLIDFAKWAVDEWSRHFGYQVYLLESVLSTKRTKPKQRLYRRRVNEMGALFLYPHPPGD
jgi:hypothetical protein